MKNTLKGSLAALAAAGLLLGGAGTLAYWNDAESVTGSAISSGRLELGAPDCGQGWTLDGGAAFTTQQLVPGDVLTKTCAIDLVATGAHLGADLAVSTAAWSATNDLTAQLQPTAVFSVNGATATHVTSADDNGGTSAEIEATVRVVFTGATATNASQGLQATLDDVTITATQTPHAV